MGERDSEKIRIERWKPILEKLNDIPTLPIVATKVTELINDPTSSSGDIAEVLKKDQVLSAKVLRLINSPYYGIPGEVTDVKRALAYLGFNTLAQLVLSVSVISLFHADNKSKFSLPEFWRHSIASAVGSEVIAKKIGHPKPEECFTCGLLHDIGKIVLMKVAADEFLKIVTLAEQEKISFHDAEKRLEVPSHGYLGEYIADRWKLPLVIRNSIRYHHTDISNMLTMLDSTKQMVRIVSLANQLVIRNSIGYSGDAAGGVIPAELISDLKLTEQDLDILSERIKKDMDNAGAFLRNAA